MSPEESVSQKQAWLANKLLRWLDQLDPVKSVEPRYQLNYRDKVCLSASWDDSGWKFGLVHQEQIIDLHHCPAHSLRIQNAVNLILKIIPAETHFPLKYYAQSGALITLIVKQKQMPDTSWLNADAIGCLNGYGINGIWLHLNPGAGRNVFAKNKWCLLWGAPRSVDSNGLIYGPKTFQQLIPELYNQALTQAQLFLSPKAEDKMIDLYCGTGNSLIRWANSKCGIVGVEMDGEAVDCAKLNAPSATVLRGKCKDRIPQLSDWIDKPCVANSCRLIYVNPPRTGVEPEMLEWVITDYKPDRMAYLSCSAGTLRRDLTLMESAGYRVIKITPYDFFPRTIHVECLALLQRNI